MSKVRIGSCGFRFKRDEYMQLLSTVEVQHTFYHPPQIPTLEGWRYTYDDDELEELAALLPKNKTANVFFNNITMVKDAVRFEEMLRRIGS